MSVEDVADDTRIRSSLIRAMESDDFRLCGGAVYARGHIRSIARVAGIDAAPIVAEFDRANHVEPQPVSVAAQPTDKAVVARADRHGPNWAAAMVVALVAICGLALIGLLRHHSPGKDAAGTSAVHHSTNQPATHPSAAAPGVPTPARPTLSQASMLIRTTNGQTWLQVKSKSGSTLFEGLLTDGRSKLFTDKHGLVFVIGNTRAVDVTVNGHDIGSPRTATVVLRGQVVPGDRNVQQT